MSCFEKGHKNLDLFKEKSEDGLYQNQIGAIGAAIAHFSIKREPALITMPTGTGKTAVMIVLSYALKAKKVLVITPSQLVREQIADSFKNPKVLLSKGIIKGKDILPKVYELTSIITKKEEWKKVLDKYDVVVGIPGTINQTPDLAKTLGDKPFDFIFVDEAHHSRAKTWTNILSSFPDAKQVLLTATPFRRDKKDIKARLIYHYPLKQAFEDKLFSKINFVPVKTEGFATEDAKNEEIARVAETTYKKRKDKNHKIIIRTDSKAAADRLFGIYRDNTGLKLQVIHSRLTDKTVKSRISELTNGTLDGIICVDMMGEGYDFPLLKIAAVHIPHKSLAITLQFIGRISRTNTSFGDEAFVIGGEHEFKIESHQLYNRDTKDWFIVLPNLHKAKIQKTEDEQDFFDSFEDLTESDGVDDLLTDQSSTIDDDDLKPFFHSKLYKIIQKSSDVQVMEIEKKISFEGLSIIKKPVIRHHHASSTYDVAIYIISDLQKPGWFTGKDALHNVSNHILIVYYDKDNSILFICTTIRETEFYEHVAGQYLNAGILHEMIPLPILKRVMAGWIDAKMYNVGMKSRKIRGNSESYKNILGSRAELGILPGDKYSYTRGHSFGGGFDSVLKKDIMIGISTSSKVWTLQENKLKYLVEWFKEVARKVGDQEMDKLNSPLSELDSGKVITEFPEAKIFFGDWDANQYYRMTTVVFLDNDEEVVESALLCSCSIKILSQSKSVIKFEVSKGSIASCIDFTIDPIIEFSYSTDTVHKISVRRGEFAFSSTDVFLLILKENPVNIFFENLDKLIGKVLFNSKENANTISSSQVISHTWPKDVDVSKEFYTKEELISGKVSKKSIHDYITELASSEFDVVFYDHSSLEIADVIGMKEGVIKFYHCKKQIGSTPRCDIEDIYEVCGQAVKSVNWAHRKLLNDQLIGRADRNKTVNKIRKGSLADIKRILSSFSNPNLPIEIVIVQPGLKTSGLRTNQKDALNRIMTLLSSADNFLQDISQCKISILCS